MKNEHRSLKIKAKKTKQTKNPKTLPKLPWCVGVVCVCVIDLWFLKSGLWTGRLTQIPPPGDPWVYFSVFFLPPSDGFCFSHFPPLPASEL